MQKSVREQVAHLFLYACSFIGWKAISQSTAEIFKSTVPKLAEVALAKVNALLEKMVENFFVRRMI